jgi:electron transport complex protein RnfE
MGLGFTLGLTTLGLIRELLGSGSIFGYKFIGDADGMLVFVLAPGAFIVLGYLIALVNRLKSK